MRSALTALLLIVVAASTTRSEPDTALYQLQERCGKSAAQLFAKEYDGGKGMKNTLLSYQAHYSPRLNKCFFLERSWSFEAEKNASIQSLQLFDLHENKEYGSFWSRSDFGVSDCRVQDTKCRSEDEWYKLAKPFLEE
jgi:hypothetical protein